MIPLKKEKAILATTAGILSAAVLAPTASGRENVPAVGVPAIEQLPGVCTWQTGSGFCYSIARTTGIIVDGVAARFDVRAYTAPDYWWGGHTNQALWVNVNSTFNDYCEVGWTKSFGGDNQFHYYWGYVLGASENYYVTGPAVVMNTSHHFQIHRAYDGLFNVYIDNVDYENCWADPYVVRADVGLEYTDDDAVAPTNDPRELQWRRASDLVWFDWGDLGKVNVLTPGVPSRWSWEDEPTHGQDWTTN